MIWRGRSKPLGTTGTRTEPKQVDCGIVARFSLSESREMTIKIFLSSAIGFGLFSAGVSAAAPANPPLPPGGAAILSWTPEQQAFGYKNMEKIAPVRVIKRGKTVHP